MSDALMRQLSDMVDSFKSVDNKLAGWKSAWPTDTEFKGSDETGAITLVITPAGEPVDVIVAANWRALIEPREIVRALNQAEGAASVAIFTQWDETLDERGATPTEPSWPESGGAPELLPPKPIEELARKLDLLLTAKSESVLYQEEASQLNSRSRFESPTGLFSVVRSGAQLVSLEAHEPDLPFTTPDILATELLGTLHEVELRAKQDQEALRAKFPALAELRALNNESN